MSDFYNLEAERSVLTILAIGKHDKFVADLEPQNFHDPEHRQLFMAMRALALDHKKINIASIAESLTRLFGSDSLMATLMQIVSETQRSQLNNEFTLTQNIEILRSLSSRRALYAIVSEARDELLDGTNDTTAVLDKTRQSLRDMLVTGHTWHSMSEVLLNTFSLFERRSKGEEKAMPSGIPTLDKLTCGLHRGELTVLGARPTVGKSALGAHMALAAAKAGYKVAICSREMSDVQYGSRVITRTANVSNQTLRKGNFTDNEWDQITDAMSLYSTLPVEFMFSTRYIEDLRTEVQRKVDTDGLDLLMVDYMQLMQTKQKFNKDFERIAYVSKTLKDMTVDLNIAIIALAQVGRAAQGDMPTMAELRGSGDIEQDADNIIFMHKPEPGDSHVNPNDRDMIPGLEMQGLRYIALNLAKQRQGEIGTVNLIFDPARMYFTEIAR